MPHHHQREEVNDSVNLIVIFLFHCRPPTTKTTPYGHTTYPNISNIFTNIFTIHIIRHNRLVFEIILFHKPKIIVSLQNQYHLSNSKRNKSILDKGKRKEMHARVSCVCFVSRLLLTAISKQLWLIRRLSNTALSIVTATTRISVTILAHLMQLWQSIEETPVNTISTDASAMREFHVH